MNGLLEKSTGSNTGRLFWFDRFLRPDQCDKIVEELRFSYWAPSTVYKRIGIGRFNSTKSRRRVSWTTQEYWFTPELNRVVRTIDRRLAALIREFSSRREGWQAIRYSQGGKFDYHLDAGFFAHEPPGERVFTVLIYLDTPPAGGSTRFKHLKIDLEAVAGRMAVWKNVITGAVKDPEMLHSSVPLLSRQKTVLVTHVRQRFAR